MIVVSNASPILNLAAIDCLRLLRQLYGKVTVPQAVPRCTSPQMDAHPWAWLFHSPGTAVVAPCF